MLCSILPLPSTKRQVFLVLVGTSSKLTTTHQACMCKCECFNKISLVMGKRVAVCGAIDFNARSTSFKRCILTRSATSNPCMIAAERMPDKYDLMVVYLQPLRAVLLAQFISASSLRGSGLRLAVAQYCV